MMSEENSGTFWDHLDVFRLCLIRSFAVVFVLSVLAFCFKDIVFDGIVLAPTKDSFPTFGFFRYIGEKLSIEDFSMELSPITIINTKLSAQLFVHLSISFYVGFLVSIPYIIGEIWFFVRPALYKHERKLTISALFFTSLLFYLGVLTSYYLIFPMSVNFLANYHVSDQVANMVDLDSYIDTLISLCLSLGAVFELPVLAHFFSRIGILSYEFMRNHRKHSFVVILILAAIITPSTDIFTMLITALPVQLVYELSVWVVKRNCKK